MQLTILSDKLPDDSVDDFKHEFRVIHANQTKDMANSLGIITRYVQGLILHSAGQQPVNNLPLRERGEVQPFAQLTWPALPIMQAAFTTDGYRNSAGKHVFGIVREIYLTERLEQDFEQSQNPKSIRLISSLSHSSESSENFKTSWDTHAAFCRTICQRYQRNLVINLSSAKVAEIFNNTQFPKDCVAEHGGCEEFTFENNVAAQEFLDKYSSQLQSSYQKFVAIENSFCIGFDNVVQYDASDRGIQQVLAGTVVGLALRSKLLLGI